MSPGDTEKNPSARPNMTPLALPLSEKPGWQRLARRQLSSGPNQTGAKGRRMSGPLTTTKAKLGRSVRSALSQATQCLAADYGLSPKESREWILQEAMAKRASLIEVARAIVIGETVAYRYDAPV